MTGKITFTNTLTGQLDHVTQLADGRVILSSNGQVVGQGTSDAMLKASQKLDGTSRRVITLSGVGTPRISST